MAKLRKHFRVAWNDGDPVDVVSNARDMAEAGEMADGRIDTGFAVVYSALKRYGHNVPATLTDFIDQLDEMTETSDSGPVETDPTDAAGSTAEPLPSRS